MKTNANSDMLGLLLSKARKGTFTGLITTKKGDERGPKGNKVVYGNDRVHVVILTGFEYGKLVQRSLDQMVAMTDDELDALLPKDGSFTRNDLNMAKAELETSFKVTLNPDADSESTTAHVYEPLFVDGEPVRGCRVYHCTGKEGCRCRDCTGEARAPKDGTIYLQGLRIWSKVLEPAPNGPVPKANSKPKTLAKNALRRVLPVSRYVSYALEPGTDFLLRAGGTAAIEATKRGFLVNDDIIDVLNKVA